MGLIEGKPRITRIIFLGIIVFISLFSLEREGAGKEEKRGFRPEHIRFGIPGTLNSPNLFQYGLGIKKEFYLREGIDLEVLSIKAAMITMAFAGTKELDYGGGSPVIRAAAAGIPSKLIFAVGKREPGFLVSDPKIASIPQLKGKRVGVSSIGDPEYLAVKQVAKKYGLDPNEDIIYIGLGPGLKIPPLLAGSVDAVVMNLTNKFLAQERGFKSLINITEFLGGLGRGFGTREEKLKKEALQVKRFIRANLKVLLFVKNSRDEVLEFLTKDLGMKPLLAKELYELLDFTIFSDEELQKRIGAEIQLYKQTGYPVKEGITPQHILDTTIFREVLKEMGSVF